MYIISVRWSCPPKFSGPCIDQTLLCPSDGPDNLRLAELRPAVNLTRLKQKQCEKSLSLSIEVRRLKIFLGDLGLYYYAAWFEGGKLEEIDHNKRQSCKEGKVRGVVVALRFASGCGLE